MNHADPQLGKILLVTRRGTGRSYRIQPYPAQIYLDRDALSPRGWLSRRGRRLLDRSGVLLSSTGTWLVRHGALPGPPPDLRMGWSG